MNFVCHCKWCCDTNSCCCTFTKEIREHESLFRGDDNDDGNLLILKVWQKSVGYDWLFRPPAVRKLRGVKRPQLELPAVEYQPSITKEIGKFGPKSLEQTGRFSQSGLVPTISKTPWLNHILSEIWNQVLQTLKFKLCASINTGESFAVYSIVWGWVSVNFVSVLAYCETCQRFSLEIMLVPQ